MSEQSPNLSQSSGSDGSGGERKKQICKKSVTQPLQIPRLILSVRRRETSPARSTTSTNRGSQPNCRLKPRKQSDQERTHLRRLHFNHQPLPSAQFSECGFGIGKGGIKRMAARMRKQDSDANRLSKLRSLQYLRDCEHSIPMARFSRMVRDIFKKELGDTNIRIQMAAMNLLREASESYLVDFFERCNLLIAHGNRVTLMPKDVELAKKLKRQAEG